MIAIILAADNGLRNCGDTPKCLMELNSETILEQQVRKLSNLGINDITVVIGKNDAWSHEHVEFISNLGVDVCTNTISNETKSGYSFHLASRDIDENVLVLNGDIVFDQNQVKSILTASEPNVLLCRPGTSPTERGGRIIVNQGRVTDAGSDIDDNEFPWYIYGGIAKLNKDTVDAINRVTNDYRSEYLLDIVGTLASSFEPSISIQTDTDVQEEEIKSIVGGSYANIEVNKYIRKETTDQGSTKLQDEIEWLCSLPEDVKPHFPEVRDYSISEESVWLEQPFYDWPSLRDLLFNSELPPEKAIEYLGTIIEFSFDRLYGREHVDPPDDFLQVYHFERVWYRLKRTKEEAPMFDDLLAADTINLDGEEYFNLPVLIQYLENNTELRSKLEPQKLSKYGHFDLHFQNILIDQKAEDFLLVDPRGYEACDPYYDLGKLYHSVNGLYDFIDTRNFVVEHSFDDGTVSASLDYLLPSTFETYREIRSAFSKIFAQHDILNEQEIMLRVKFNEVMHYSSLLPFHLENDGYEAKATAFYFTAVKLANEFVREYGDDFSYDDWVDVNTVEQYKQVRNWRLKGE
jgi:choline kinase